MDLLYTNTPILKPTPNKMLLHTSLTDSSGLAQLLKKSPSVQTKLLAFQSHTAPHSSACARELHLGPLVLTWPEALPPLPQHPKVAAEGLTLKEVTVVMVRKTLCQTESLKATCITYLRAKQAAGGWHPSRQSACVQAADLSTLRAAGGSSVTPSPHAPCQVSSTSHLLTNLVSERAFE